jgi:signal transduction histidine kinase/CheY-like chemotaxis protein
VAGQVGLVKVMREPDADPSSMKSKLAMLKADCFSLWCDPVVRLATVVGVLALVPSYLPRLSPSWVEPYENYYSNIPLILVVVLAFQFRLSRLPSRVERFFWHVWTLGFVSWLFVSILDVVVPSHLASHPHLLLVRTAGFTGIYLAAAVALELKPHTGSSNRTTRFERLDTIGAVVVAFGFFAYFALIPAVLSEQAFRSAVPSMLVYLTLDAYLAFRLAVLIASPEAGRGWRLSYAWLLLAVLFWAGADAVETLGWANLMPAGTVSHLLNAFWLPPFLALVVAVRLRHGKTAAPATRSASTAAAAPPRRRGPLILQAASLPLVHITLAESGALDPETAAAREACAVVVFLLLSTLAVIYQRWMEKENEKLTAARLREAEAASRAKSQFVAQMSHELRTPLNGVLGAADLLLRSGLTGSQRRLGEILRLSAQSLMELVNDVLDFSRIEAGRLELEEVEFDPRRLTQDLAALMAPQAERKGLVLSYRSDPRVPSRLWGDPKRLRQILVNLVANAVKFTERGQVSLRLEPGKEEGGRVMLRFEVRDTGVGIPPGSTDTIFEAFCQAEDSTSHRFGGSGLGLAISRELARLMDGDLQYESELGVGTTFYLTVRPAAAPSTSDAEAAAKMAGPVPGDGDGAAATLEDDDEQRRDDERARGLATSSTPRGRVLLVDDNAVNLEVARAMLSLLGCEVDVAEDGRQALASFSSHRYDVVFMDCLMPVMDGFEATAALRSLEANARPAQRTPVIALTASATTEDRARCLAADMDDYLPKPFRQEGLEAMLRRWLPPTGSVSADATMPSDERAAS